MKPTAPGQKLPAAVTLLPNEDGNLWLDGIVRVVRTTNGTEIHIIHPIVAGEPKTCTALGHAEIVNLSAKVRELQGENKKLADEVAAREPEPRLAELVEELEKRADGADERRHQGAAGGLFAQQAVAYRDAAAQIRKTFRLPPRVAAEPGAGKPIEVVPEAMAVAKQP